MISDQRQNKDVIILLHAAVVNHLSLKLFGRRLTDLGFRVVIPPYPNRRLPITDCADWLLPLWRSVSDSAEAAVHLAGHSMGGLVARRLIHLYQPPNLGRLVTMGTPHLGSPLANILRKYGFFHKLFGPAGENMVTGQAIDDLCPWPPPCETGLIAGTIPIGPGTLIMPCDSDGTVTHISSQPAGASDYARVPASHTTIPYIRRTALLTANFLRTGRFYPDSVE